MIKVNPLNLREPIVDNNRQMTRIFGLWVNNASERVNDTLAVYRQDTEPQLTKADQSAFWVDTTTGNALATYLIFCRSEGDQVKVQLT